MGQVVYTPVWTGGRGTVEDSLVSCAAQGPLFPLVWKLDSWTLSMLAFLATTLVKETYMFLKKI